MLFNSGTTTNSIVAKLNRKTGANNTSYPLADKATDCNEALDRYWYLAMLGDARWQIDDTNNTDLPILTTNLVSGQQDYSLPTDLLVLEKGFVEDSNGLWLELDPVDISQTKLDTNADNTWLLPSNNSGVPKTYDKKANSIFLDPIPNYNSTGGLKLVLKRGPSYFVYNDTTKAPGIPAIHHNFLVDYAAWTKLSDTLSTNIIARKVQELEKKIASWEASIKDYYANRSADEPLVLKPINFVRR